MNAQWQQVHQGLTNEAEGLRQKTAESEQLQTEVAQLRDIQARCLALESALQEAEVRGERFRSDAEQLRGEQVGDHDAIQRLQSVVEALQDRSDSEAGLLEAELLERGREAGVLRREAEELRRQNLELQQERLAQRESAEAGERLRGEVDRLEKDLEKALREKTATDDVARRCLEKLQHEGLERPHLVDKRMVTQMLAAYLEQRDNQKARDEVMARMADLLGFTAAERAQVGLSQKRKGLSLEPEPVSLEELTNQFVDFLHEEAEA